jgi:hypothetical protein
LRRNAPQDPFRRLRNQQLSARLGVRIHLAGLLHRHLQVRVFDQFRALDDGLHRIRVDLAGLFIENRAQIFLGLVVLARGDHDRVFYRADHDLRINALFPADRVDDVVELACHNQFSVLRSQFSVRRRFAVPEN